MPPCSVNPSAKVHNLPYRNAGDPNMPELGFSLTLLIGMYFIQMASYEESPAGCHGPVCGKWSLVRIS